MSECLSEAWRGLVLGNGRGTRILMDGGSAEGGSAFFQNII